jgi:hypothetical protein
MKTCFNMIFQGEKYSDRKTQTITFKEKWVRPMKQTPPGREKNLQTLRLSHFANNGQ